MGRLETTPDRLPVVIAAGVIKTREDFNLIANNQIVSLVVPGTYTSNERINPNPKAKWNEELQQFDNSFQFANAGRKNTDLHLPEDIKRMHDTGILVTPSVGAGHDENPMEVIPQMAEWVLETGADGVELNPDCPNFDSDFSFRSPDQVAELIRLTRSRTGAEAVLSVKLPGNLSKYSFQQILSLNPAVDIWAPSNSFGGLSGPLMNNMFRQNTRQVIEVLDEAENNEAQVISTGGVSGSMEGGAEIYNRVYHMGATLVALAQHPFRLKNDPKAFDQMFVDLKEGIEFAQAA